MPPDTHSNKATIRIEALTHGYTITTRLLKKTQQRSHNQKLTIDL